MSEGDARTRRDRRRPRARGRPRAAARVARRGRARRSTRTTLIALMQDDDFSHSRPLRAAPAARTSASCAGAVDARGRGAHEHGGDVGTARARAVRRPASPVVPYAPARRSSRASRRSSTARERRAARASRSSPTASAAMHGVTHTLAADPRARRARLRGRGRRHRPRRRPPAAAPSPRSTIPFYAGPAGRRPEPAGGRRDAGRGPLRPRPPRARRARPASPRR